MYFSQTLIDNHKLVIISIFSLLKHDKNEILFFLKKNIHEKLLGFGRMYKNKKYFFLCFGNEKFCEVFEFFCKVSKKIKYF